MEHRARLRDNTAGQHQRSTPVRSKIDWGRMLTKMSKEKITDERLELKMKKQRNRKRKSSTEMKGHKKCSIGQTTKRILTKPLARVTNPILSRLLSFFLVELNCVVKKIVLVLGS